MKPRAAYLLSIAAAIPPLLAALAITWGLYVYAGVGKPRNFYDLIRSNESLVREARLGTASPMDATDEYAPRWSGTADDPLNLLLIGTSPSMHAVIPSEAEFLERDLHINFFNVARSNFRFYRFFDEIRILSTMTDIDIIIIEYSVGLVSDHRLAYRYGSDNWRNQVFDPEIYETIASVRRIWRDEDVPPMDESMRMYQRNHEATKDNWLGVAADPDEPRVPHYERRPYRSGLERRLDRDGFEDLDTHDVEVIRTNYVSLSVLMRIREFCVANDIGLVVYVPSISDEYEGLEGVPLWQDQERYARAALRYFGERYNVKVLDYYDLNNSTDNFIDPIHLYREPAIEFSKLFFSELYAFFESGGTDLRYVDHASEGVAPVVP